MMSYHEVLFHNKYKITPCASVNAIGDNVKFKYQTDNAFDGIDDGTGGNYIILVLGFT